MAVTPADQDQAFLREVDENLRADQLADFWKRWGRWLIAAVGAGLIALAGFLWWSNHRQALAGEEGEELQAAFNNIGAGNPAGAEKTLDALSTSDVDGYRAAALLTQAAIAVDKKDTKAAAAKFAAVANDKGLAQPYRDMALIKQTAMEFDQLQPQAVIDRLRPLATKDSAFFGTAGEMVAISYLRQNKRADAGKLFAELARDASVPDSIRQRAVQMAGVLGIDAVGQNAGSQGESETTK